MTVNEIVLDFENRLASCKVDEERCNVYEEVVPKLFIVNLEIASKIGDEYVAISKKADLPGHQANALMGRANTLSKMGDYSSALQDYNQCLLIIEGLQQSNSKEVVDNYNMIHTAIFDRIADVYAHVYVFDEAIEYLQKAIDLANGKYPISTFKHNLAHTYSRAKLFDKAKELYLEVIEEGHNPENSLVKLYWDYIEIGDLLMADETLERCKEFREPKTPWILISYYLASADKLRRAEDLKEAKLYLIKAKNKALEFGGVDGLLQVLQEEGNFYIQAKDWDNAEECFLKELSLSKDANLKEHCAKALNSLKELFTKQGQFQKALDFANQYISLNEKIKLEQTKNLQKILDVKQRFAIVQKEKDITDKKNVLIQKEKQESERLLLNILPAEVAEELKANGSAAAKQFDDVTVLYTDFVSFTKVGERLTPQQLVDELNVCFKAFDEIITKYNIEKIKTMGDGFIAAAGLPTANISHAEDMINAAIEIRDFMLQRRIQQGENTFEMRVGINSGPVVAGIVGVKKFAYDIWGDTVNTAARMEQNSEAGKINISQTTYELVKDKFNCEYRGEIEAKNKGLLKMYFVN